MRLSRGATAAGSGEAHSGQTSDVVAVGALDVPALTGPVVDEDGLLDAGSRRRIEALSRAALAQGEGRNSVSLVFLIVRTLDGEAIEDFSMLRQ